jgi:hypothetical protein
MQENENGSGLYRVEIKMNKKLVIVTLPILFFLIIPFVVQSATITTCAFDKDNYLQGEIGWITVSIYNDEDTKIRITELTATINYYYTDGNVYLQSFSTNATLPAEIQQGDSSTLYIRFSLPTNIASGYTDVHVKAKTEQWNSQGETWFGSDHPTYQPTLYIESPYKQQSEEYEQQLEQQLTINMNTTNMMYLFVTTTLVFATVTAILFVLNRKTRLTT